jgi:hypothetical protein
MNIVINRKPTANECKKLHSIKTNGVYDCDTSERKHDILTHPYFQPAARSVSRTHSSQVQQNEVKEHNVKIN